MKTKLLSVFLVLAMLMTSVLCVLPASAVEVDLDANAVAAGKVCRVGTAEEATAAESGPEGYYDSTVQAAFQARGSGKTVTLITDVTLTENNIWTDGGHSLIFDGNNHTLTINSANKLFRANGGTLTVKNLKIKVENSTEGVVTSNGGVMTFENCSFTTTAKYKRAHGFISSNTSAEASLTFKNCNFSIDATSEWAKKGTAFFHRYGRNNPVLNFEGTTLDLSNTVLPLSNSGNVILSVKDGSTIKTTKSIPSANVTIIDSAVECTADDVNLFNYSNYGTVNVTAISAKLTGKKYVFKFEATKDSANVTLDGDTVVNGTKRAFSVTNNLCPVKITAKGNTTIQSSGNEAIYVCGSDSENATFALTMMDKVTLTSPKDGVSFAVTSGTRPIKKATIKVLDAVTIDVPNGTFLPTSSEIANGAITYIRYDRATMNVREQYTDASKFVVSDVCSPVMEKGASVRIVPDLENSNGLRFTSTLVNNATPSRYGTLIVKAADLGDTEFTIAALTAANIKFANIAATEEGTVAGGDKTTYNAALVNLPDAEFTTEFAARAYAVYTVNGEEYIVYSDFTAKDNVRSLVNVAEAALNDTKPTQSEEHCYKIAEDVYSPYTPAQYEVLKAYAAKKN